MTANVVSLDDLVDDVLDAMQEADRRRRRVLGACSHCRRRLRVDPDAGVVLCARCAALPQHDAESRLYRAIFAEPSPCSRCATYETDHADCAYASALEAAAS